MTQLRTTVPVHVSAAVHYVSQATGIPVAEVYTRLLMIIVNDYTFMQLAEMAKHASSFVHDPAEPAVVDDSKC